MRGVAAVRGLVLTAATATAACGAAVAPPVAIGNRVGATGSPQDARDRWWSVRYRWARPGEPVVIGRVVDRRTGEPASGATVVLDHGGAPAWEFAEITDEDGRFAFVRLPPGTRRRVTFFGEAEFVIDRVPVTAGWQATIDQRIDTTIAASEVIEIGPWPGRSGP